MKIVHEILQELHKFASNERAEINGRFFKTKIGNYSHCDIFAGITVPNIRKIAKKYIAINLENLSPIISSKIHEERLLAIIIFVEKYKNSTFAEDFKRKIMDLYLKNIEYINNWDIVDISCYKILGDFILKNPDMSIILTKLAESTNIWEKRIAIVSTLALIKKNQYEITIKIAEKFLNETHDFLHKAMGSMLREIGKKTRNYYSIFYKYIIN